MQSCDRGICFYTGVMEAWVLYPLQTQNSSTVAFRMGNSGSSSSARQRIGRIQPRYGAVAQDHVLVNSNIIEYPSALRRNLALIAILVCQTFFWVAFSIIFMWIPQTLQLNVFFFNSDEDRHGYFDYMKKWVWYYYTVYAPLWWF